MGAGFSPHVRPEGRTHKGEVGFDASQGHGTRSINLIPVRAICVMSKFNGIIAAFFIRRLIWTSMGFSPHVRPEGRTHMFPRYLLNCLAMVNASLGISDWVVLVPLL